MRPDEKLLLKKYAALFLRTMLMLACVLVLGLLLKPEETGPAWKAAVFAVAGAICIYFLWGVWRLVRTYVKTDEMGEAIFARGGSYAHSACIALAAAYGMLETIAGLPRVSMTLFSVVMIVIGFVSVALVNRRYA
jgi:hypothetical protein